MELNLSVRRLLAVALVAAAALGSAPPVRAADLPALNNPKSQEDHPGKFAWSELLTTDAPAATLFYAGVFGWSTAVVDQGGVSYTIFSSRGRPVAGMRERSRSAPARTSRWIHYIAVRDVIAALSLATQGRGQLRAQAREFPNLGILAIATDPEGAPFGLIQSSSGVAADDEPTRGDWNWFHLFVRHPRAAADYYHRVFGYRVDPDGRPGKGGELLLSTDDFNRGGISALPAVAEAGAGWLGVIRVGHMDRLLGRVPVLGGQILIQPREASLGSRFAVIEDPSGGTVGVVEYANDANPANPDQLP